MSCTCPPVADLITGSLTGKSAPPCSAHRPNQPAEQAPVALNDDAALLGSICAALGVTLQPHPQGDSDV